MSVVVGYLPTAEGRAALRRAAQESSLRGTDLVVIESGSEDLDPEARAESEQTLLTVLEELDRTGVQHSVRHVAANDDHAEELIAAAEDLSAEVIVIGLRRRSPVGKLVLGSSAQRILLDAPCAVLAVKAPTN